MKGGCRWPEAVQIAAGPGAARSSKLIAALDRRPLAMANISRPAWRPPWKFLLPFVAVHASLSVGLFAIAFSQGMDRFDSGLPATFGEKTIELVSGILLSPIFKLSIHSRLLIALLPGRLGYLPMLANSVLWAFLTWWLLAILARRYSASSHPPRPENPVQQ